jgi:hypothetical protein
MKPQPGRREASWSAAVLCRCLATRPKAPADWRTPKAAAPSPRPLGRILGAKRANPQVDTSAWEREIDERVYRLYGLTPEEIKIVEGATK